MNQRTSSYVQNYLTQTRKNNAANQMNFAGNDSRYANMSGGMRSFTGGNGSYFNAAGAAAPAAAMAPAATPSHPYAITVSNSNASTQNNFQLFGGNTTPPGSTGWSGGSYTSGGVTVSGVYASYQTLVSQSMTQPFTIGSTWVGVVSGSNAQVQQPLQVTTTDASGLTQGVPIPFRKDPYQNQSDILVNNTPYRIDGTTVVAITALLANTVVTYEFYPAQNINPASALMGQDTNRFYQNPGLIRVLPVATGAQ